MQCLIWSVGDSTVSYNCENKLELWLLESSRAPYCAETTSVLPNKNIIRLKYLLRLHIFNIPPPLHKSRKKSFQVWLHQDYNFLIATGFYHWRLSCQHRYFVLRSKCAINAEPFRFPHFEISKWGGCITSGSSPSDLYFVQCGFNARAWTESSHIKSLDKHVCHFVFHANNLYRWGRGIHYGRSACRVNWHGSSRSRLLFWYHTAQDIHRRARAAS